MEEKRHTAYLWQRVFVFFCPCERPFPRLAFMGSRPSTALLLASGIPSRQTFRLSPSSHPVSKHAPLNWFNYSSCHMNPLLLIFFIVLSFYLFLNVLLLIMIILIWLLLTEKSLSKSYPCLWWCWRWWWWWPLWCNSVVIRGASVDSSLFVWPESKITTI